MGQKVNPIGIRLGITRDWGSKWYASTKNFPAHVYTDFLVREFLKKKLVPGKNNTLASPCSSVYATDF